MPELPAERFLHTFSCLCVCVCVYVYTPPPSPPTPCLPASLSPGGKKAHVRISLCVLLDVALPAFYREVFFVFFPPCVCNHDKDCLVTRPPSLIHPVCSDRTPRCCSCRIIECRFPFRVLAFSRVKAAAMLMAFRGRGRSKTQRS